MNKDETTNFIKSVGTRAGGISEHAYSQFAADNWDQVATECYIRTKAKNLLNILGIDAGEDSPMFQTASGIVYATGDIIRMKKERADGWELFSNGLKFTPGEPIELKTDSILGGGILKGTLVLTPKGSFAVLPKRNRTRGYVIGSWDKVRKPQEATRRP